MCSPVLRHHPDNHEGSCGLCGRPVTLVAGLQLFGAESGAPLCPECGRQEAPALAALLGLAWTAERVGKIVEHTLSPPLTALLELARAAEDYSGTVPR